MANEWVLNEHHRQMVDDYDYREDRGGIFGMIPVEVDGERTSAILKMVHCGDKVMLIPWLIVPTHNMKIVDNHGVSTNGTSGYYVPIDQQED